MESFLENVFKKTFIKFLIAGSFISIALIGWKIHNNRSNELIVKHEIKNQ